MGSRATDANAFCAGLVAGACGTLVGHPFDTVKALHQTSNSSVFAAQRKRLSLRFIRSLYRGLLPPLLTTGVFQCLSFGAYDHCLRLLSQGDSAGEAPLWHVSVAAAFAGAFTSAITAPVIRMKLMRQVHNISQPVFLGSLGRTYAGFPIHLVLETVGRSVYLTAFELAKAIFVTRFERSEGVKEVPVKFLCGCIAGVVGWSSIYPLDVIRSRVMASSSHGGPQGILEVALHVWKKGLLWRGLSFTLLRAAPVAGVTLPTYEYTLAFLRRQQLMI